MKTYTTKFLIGYKFRLEGFPSFIAVEALNEFQAITRAAIEIMGAYGSEMISEVIFL